jgi:hypothetical protein
VVGSLFKRMDKESSGAVLEEYGAHGARRWSCLAMIIL